MLHSGLVALGLKDGYLLAVCAAPAYIPPWSAVIMRIFSGAVMAMGAKRIFCCALLKRVPRTATGVLRKCKLVVTLSLLSGQVYQELLQHFPDLLW
ncbi:hypothetical protein HYPSUDRAFT_518477 [Hypholoma sublateritium FD-334 SS-4]|uniref:Uncharacterized protein n=1 Tax=Hypholoma sublateritium (strain FD-334 SS-4) TaxID=945553 RepID=A0A0D2PM86_HYPSF|nr:hypothetical protein HYPSUDRAFT_518477 [Hypholoma sublateritium FD-334 SS-4]